MKLLSRSLCVTVYKNFRQVSTNQKLNTETVAAAVSKKEKYYKQIGEIKEDHTKPAGWDEARPFESIPGPKGLPVIGNLWRFLPCIGQYHGLDVLEIHKKLLEDHGQIATLGGSILTDNIIVIFDPEAAETLLRNEGPWPLRFGMPSFVHYRSVTRKEIFGGVSGLMSLQGQEWFNMRSPINPILMQPRTAAQYVDIMDNVAAELVENIRHFSKQNPQGEMQPNFINELYKWALESVGVIALDRRLGCLKLDLAPDSELQTFIDSVLRMFELSFQLDIAPSLWKYYSTPTWKKFVKVLDFITFYLLKQIEEVIEDVNKNADQNLSAHERSVLVRLLKIDKKIALATIMDLMTAGVDTTGRTLGAALYYLARHPEKQEKLREELNRLLPKTDSALSKDILNDALYLKAVIKETTRLSPIGIGVLRTTIKDLVLCGYQIPKGTQVLTNNIILSHSDKYFPRAKEFIPERYLRSTTGELSYKNTNQFVSLPFGFGPRSCIGKRLANLELEIAIAKIIRNFNLSWSHEDMPFKTVFLHGIAGPLKLHVEEIAK